MKVQSLDGEDIIVVHGLLSPEECDALIARSEALGYEAAGLGEELATGARNNARSFFEDRTLADELWRRAAPMVPKRRGDSEACGLHQRFRFYRYDTAEHFGPHFDGSVSRGDGEASQLTFMIYLSDVAEGGGTVFYGPGLVRRFEVEPEPGKALIFDHLQLHEGAPVIRGRKYVLRTDVLFRRVSSDR